MEFFSYQIIPLNHFIILAAIIFVIGVAGILMNHKNIISFLMSIELTLLAVNMNFIAFSVYLNDIIGQVFAMFVLTVAAAEVAIGIAIMIVYFRNKGSIAVEEIDMMRG